MEKENADIACDRNLLFGLVAVELHYLKPADLTPACRLWTEDPQQELGAVLVKTGLLTEKDRAEIDKLLGQSSLVQLAEALTILSRGGTKPTATEPLPAPAAKLAGIAPLLSFGGELADLPETRGPTPEKNLDDTERVTHEHPGRYSLKGEHGRGGIGRVLIAFDEHIGREVALKELLPQKDERDAKRGLSPGRFTSAMARFLREARITGQLEHPGIVPVYEIARRPDGSLFYTMKLVRGQTLADKLKACQNLGDRLALLNHFLDLCQAMAYAHAQGVIHRDLKPANIMVGEFGETVVLDWGLAKVKGLEDVRATELADGLKLIKEADAGKTLAGQALGTPWYMSPEQADGRIAEIDEHSDIWSLGAILYELLTGRPPFTGELPLVVIGKVMKDPIVPVLEIEPKAPPELCAIAEKCLQRDHRKRYANAGELTRDVAGFQAGGLVSAYEYSMAALAGRWLKKRWPVVATAAAALIVLIAVGAGSVVQIGNERNLALDQKKLAEQKAEEAKLNLAEADYQLGLRVEKDQRWNDAKIYFAQALSLSGREEARSGFYLAASRPFRIGLKKSLPGHGFQVVAMAVSPDGKVAASGSCGKENERKECVQGEIRLWSVAQGLGLKTLTGHDDVVQSLAFSPDGKWLASGGRDSVIKIWSLETGECIRTIPRQGAVLYYFSIAISPDSKYLLSGGSSSDPQLWSAETGELVRTFRGHDPAATVMMVAFSPDGKTAASGASNGEARIWSVADGACLKTLRGHTYPVSSVAFSPDGREALTGSWDKTLKLWSVATGLCLHTFAGHEDRVYSGSFSPDGKYLLSSSRDRTLKLWQRVSGECIYTFTGHDEDVYAATFSPDGKLILSASADQTVKVWSLETSEPIRTLTGHQATIWEVKVSPDGKSLLSVSGDNTLRLWSFPNGDLIRTFAGHQSPAAAGAFAPDGKTIVSGSCHDYSNNLCHQGELKIWSTDSGECLKTFAVLNNWVESIAYSPDGKSVVTGSCSARGKQGNCNQGGINFWSVATGENLSSWQGHGGDVYSLAFTPDGQSLLSGSADLTLKLWSLPTGACLRTLTGHENSVDAVAVSPDGKSALSISLDKTMKLWSLETGACLRTIAGPDLGVFVCDFYPDGRYAISGGRDNTLKLWSLATGNLVLTFRGHEGTVTSAHFSRDGKYLVSAGDDKTIRIWPMKWDLFTESGEKLLGQAEQETGLRLEGTRVVPWSPAAGK